MRISPPSGFSRPATQRSRVVFPDPLSPNSTKNSCAPTSMETPSTARAESWPDLYILKRFLIDIIALLSARMAPSQRQFLSLPNRFANGLCCTHWREKRLKCRINAGDNNNSTSRHIREWSRIVLRPRLRSEKNRKESGRIFQPKNRRERESLPAQVAKTLACCAACASPRSPVDNASNRGGRGVSDFPEHFRKYLGSFPRR